MTQNKPLVLYISINTGIVAVSLLEYAYGVPPSFVIGLALFDAVFLNPILWLVLKKIGRHTLENDLHSSAQQRGVVKQRKTLLWLAISFFCLGFALAAQGFWDSDIPNICSGLFSLAFGAILTIRLRG
jgi:hypothetical protein